VRVWQVVRLVAGGGIVVVLGAAALIFWPLLWPPDPDASVQLVNGRLVGETAGYVGRVDGDARIVEVSSSLVGWRPLALVVNEHTSILIQDRQGGFGDLAKDLPVRVSYEVVGDQRVARSIEVMADEDGRTGTATHGRGVGGPASPTPIAITPVLPPAPEPVLRPPAAHQAETVTQPAAAAAPSGRAATVEPAAPAPALPPKAVAPPAGRSSRAPSGQAPPPAITPSGESGRVRGEAAATAPLPPRSVPPRLPASAEEPLPRLDAVPPRPPAARAETEGAGAARPAPRPAEPESDGGAAIDWLLKRGR
jgi:hypothetical protein